MIGKGISLLFRKIPTGKIDPKALGWVSSDGKIVFQSEEAAFNYAKNRVLQALHAPIPYERGLKIKGNTIIADVRGDGNSVNFGKIDVRGAIGVHGHPESTPLSIDDYISMMRGGQTAEYAINPMGEYSKFTMLPAFWGKLLPKTLRDKLIRYEQRGNAKLCEKAFVKYMFPLAEKFTKLGQEIGLELQKVYKNADAKTKKIIANAIEQFKKDCYLDTSTLPESVRPVFERLVNLDKYETKIQTPEVHKFWQKNAEKYGVKYETTFSNLA